MRSGPGEARTILLLHIISVRPSKQPLMVRTFLKVYMELGSYFLFLQEQIKDIIISSIKKDSGDYNWIELDWTQQLKTQQLKNSWPLNSNERKT